MAHSFKLGYKANPFGTDDYIDLCDISFGYQLMGYELGDVTVDDTNREVRTIKLKVNAKSAAQSQSAVLLLVRKIQNYLDQTTNYLEPQGSNISSSSDGTWHEGKAATLTVRFDGAEHSVYWEVLGGRITNRADFIDQIFGSGMVTDIAVEIDVIADARGDRSILDNLVHCGDFPLTWNIQTAPADWLVSLSSSVYPTVSTTVLSPLSTNSLYLTGNANWNLSTNRFNTYPTMSGDKLVPFCYFMIDTPLTGSMAIEFSIFSSSTFGGTYSILSSYNSGGYWAYYNSVNPMPVNQWVKITGPALTVTSAMNYLQLNMGAANVPTGMKFYLSAPALWRNPTNSLAPSEYISCGGSAAHPYLDVYNVRGDRPAPFKLRGEVNDQSLSTLHGHCSYLHIGGRQLIKGVDLPIDPFLIRNATIANADSSSVFGGFSKTQALINTSAKTVQFNFNTSGLLDREARNYRLLMYFAFETDMVLQSLTLTLCNETRYYNTMPGTTTNNVPASTVVGDFRIVDLGEFHFGRKGVGWSDLSSAVAGSLVFQYGTVFSASNVGYFTGFIAIPTEQYVLLNFQPNVVSGAFVVETESDNIAVGYQPNAFPMNDVPYDFGSYSTYSEYYGGNLMLYPSLNKASYMNYVTVPLNYLIGDIGISGPIMYDCDARTEQHYWIEYNPRYEMGIID